MPLLARDPASRFARATAAGYALPGLLGSALMALGALGVGWLPASSTLIDAALVDALRSTAAGAVLSRVAVFAGIALLLQAWLVLGHDVLDNLERSERRLNGILAVWIAPLILMPPLFSRDAFSYFAQGQLVLAGLNPYRTGVSALPGWFLAGADPLWAESPTPYGPAFLLLEQGVAALAGTHAYAGAILFRLIALVGVALLAVYVPRLAWAHGIDPAKALWLAVLNPLVLMHFVAGAHNDALMVGLMVAGLALGVERSPVLGIALIALAGAVKPIALVILPFAGLLWAGVRATWPRRILAWVKSSAVVLIVFALLSATVGVGLGWVASLSTPGSVRTWLSPPTAIGMLSGGLLELLGLADSSDGAVSFVRAVAMLAGAACGLYLVLRPEGRSPVRGAALGLLAIVTLGPVIQPWYLLWVLPLLAATGLTGMQLRAAMLVTSVLVLHAMVESNATADTLVDVRDGIAAAFAVLIVSVVLLSSPGERRLIMGDPVDRGMRPTSHAARVRAGALVVHRAESSTS
ncbi:MAG: polyprenol phosphomannose-dependent alpha 1,6 mannosyltransferase MptB [Candidatus Nanopelagicales bacterium]